MKIKQENIDMLNSLLVAYELLECLDRIKLLPLYRNGLKEKVKLLMPELEKFANQLSVLFGIDDETMLNLIADKKALMLKIAGLRPEIKSGLNEILNHFHNQPELTLHRLGIQIIEK